MATQTVKLVEGNSAPPIVLTAQRPDGTVINLTGATVSLIVTKARAITNAGHQTCVLTIPASGIVTYTPTTTDFPTQGTYVCDLKIVYSDTTVEIVYDQLRVIARLRADSTA